MHGRNHSGAFALSMPLFPLAYRIPHAYRYHGRVKRMPRGSSITKLAAYSARIDRNDISRYGTISWRSLRSANAPKHSFVRRNAQPEAKKNMGT